MGSVVVAWCRGPVPDHVPEDQLLHYRDDHGHGVLAARTVRELREDEASGKVLWAYCDWEVRRCPRTELLESTP